MPSRRFQPGFAAAVIASPGASPAMSKRGAIEERPRHWQGWAPSRVLGIPRAAPAVAPAKVKTRQDARQIARKVPVPEWRQAAGLQMRTVPSGSAIAPSVVRAMLELSVSTTNPNCRPLALDVGPLCRRIFRALPATRSPVAFPCPRLVHPPARSRGRSRACERGPWRKRRPLGRVIPLLGE